MKLGLALAAFASFCIASIASAFPTEAAVQIRSAPCSGTAPELRGSGVAFRHKDKAYVVTAQSVLYHDNFGLCHRLTHPKWGASGAFLVAVDWGFGLAVLEATQWTADSAWPELSDLTGDAPIVGRAVQLAGFEIGNAAPSLVSGGAVLIAGGNRHSIPSVAQTIEVQGAEVEAGLVGGPVVAIGGGFLGLLSQQYLKMTPGSSTRPREWDFKAGHREPHVLVLPGAVVSNWLLQVFTQPTSTPYYVDPNDQMKGAAQVSSGPLKFVLYCPPPGTGGPGGPVGGGDGVGVGGSQASAPFCQVSFARQFPQKTALPVVALASWADAIDQDLQKGRKVEVKYYLGRDPATRLLVRAPFWSLADAFTRLKTFSLVPVVVRTPAPGETPADPTLAELRKEGAAALPFAIRIFPFLDNEEIKRLARDGYLLGEMMGTEQWSLVTKTDVDGFLDVNGRHKRAWDTLLMYFKPDTQSLRDHLGRIRALLP